MQSDKVVKQEAEEPQDEEDDQDDPLAGELDEPEEDDDEDDDEEDEEEEGGGDESDSVELTSPILDPGTNAQFGSKTVRTGQMGSKTVPPSAPPPKPKKQRKPSIAKEDKEVNEATDARDSRGTKESTPRESSVPASIKGGRRSKSSKRNATPKATTPAAPKKKELSVVCHKLLDNFIK